MTDEDLYEEIDWKSLRFAKREPEDMTIGERMIYATAFSFAWGTRYEEAKNSGRVNLTQLACDSASAAAATVHVFRIAAERLPTSDAARPFLDEMRKP